MKRWIGLASAFVFSVAMGQSAAADTVVVYNCAGNKLMESLADAFKKATPGTSVDIINGGVGELITRIRAERARPRGDVYFGCSTDAFDSAIDLFEGYKSKEDAAFDRSVVQKDFKYYGFSLPLQAFVVNTKMMPADKAPKSWADLAKPEYKGKLLMANPAQSGSAYWQMLQIVQLHGWDTMAKVIQNATFVTSSKLAYQNVGKGEFAVGMTGEFNILVMQDEGMPVTAIYPSDGTPFAFDGNGLIKGGPNPEGGKKFIDYANSLPAHRILVDLDKRRSVRSDVTPPPGLPKNTDIKTLPFDSLAAAKSRTENLEKFDKLFAAK
jgi:iron(III) transport system substrate-binding protein